MPEFRFVSSITRRLLNTLHNEVRGFKVCFLGNSSISGLLRRFSGFACNRQGKRTFKPLAFFLGCLSTSGHSLRKQIELGNFGKGFWIPWTHKPRKGLLRSFGGFSEGFWARREGTRHFQDTGADRLNVGECSAKDHCLQKTSQKEGNLQTTVFTDIVLETEGYRWRRHHIIYQILWWSKNYAHRQGSQPVNRGRKQWGTIRQNRNPILRPIVPRSKEKCQMSTSVTWIASWFKVTERGLLSSYSESSSCRFISRHCHASHAQMHADFKGPNPGPYSGLVTFISGNFGDSGQVHILWASRHFFWHGSRAGQDQSTRDQGENQVNDEDDNHIIIKRGEKVQMGLSSSGRSGHQYVCSWS